MSIRFNGLSVVIPVYNGEGSLSILVERLKPILQQVAADSYELILVNDGSADRSWEVICELASSEPWLRGIDLMRNYGQHNALLCGIRAAQYEVIVTMDDDLQHPPEEIPRLIEKLAEGYDVVYGTPEQGGRHGFWRNLASQVTKMALQSTISAKIARNVSAFRVFRTQLRDAFAHYKCSFVLIDVLLTWGTRSFGAVSVCHDRRSIGNSNYTFRMLVTHALNMVTGFSTVPLQLASMIGFGFSLFGGGILFYVVGRYLILGEVVPGFAFLASIIAIFSGAQLLAIGIIGEYLSRLFFRSMDRPTYTVRDQIVTEK